MGLSKILIISTIVLILLILAGFIYLNLSRPKFDLSGFDLELGADVYGNTCISCHLPGQFGAPKLGYYNEWAPRIERGLDTLLHNALNGFNSMPARGGNPHLSDEEVKAAVAFMVSKL